MEQLPIGRPVACTQAVVAVAGGGDRKDRPVAQGEPRPTQPALIDSHCHLDLAQFEPDREDVIARARQEGVVAMVNPGIDVEHSRQAIQLAEGYAPVYAAVGVHPNSSQEFGPQSVDHLREMAQHPKVVAVGEIGLDYYWQRVSPRRQRQALEAQLTLAAEIGLPVIIHSRDANEEVAAVLRSWVRGPGFRESKLAQRPYAGVLHAFSGDLQLAEEAYGWGFVLSLGGPVTFQNARELRDLVPGLRPNRMMLETDAPYLTPHPLRGKRNEPAYLVLVCRALAQLWGTTPQEVARQSTRLAVRFFDLQPVEEVVPC